MVRRFARDIRPPTITAAHADRKLIDAGDSRFARFRIECGHRLPADGD